MKEQLLTPDMASYAVNDAQRAVNRISLARIEEMTDDARMTCDTDGGQTIEFGLLKDSCSGEDLDTSQIIVMPLPFGNGLDNPSTIRAKMLQRSLPNLHPVLMLPNSSFRHTTFQLSEDERDKVAGGNFAPIADMQAAAFDYVEHLFKDDSSALIDGYSQGASVGAVLAGKVSTKAALLAEAPNVTTRVDDKSQKAQEKALSKAFTAPGLSPLNSAIDDGGMPAHNEAQGVKNGGKTTPTQLIRLTKYGIGTTLSAENRALKRGMAHRSFIPDLQEALAQNPEMFVTVARSAGSLIMSRLDSAHIARAFDGLDAMDLLVLSSGKGEDQEYGHAAGDHLPLHAEAFRRPVLKSVA